MLAVTGIIEPEDVYSGMSTVSEGIQVKEVNIGIVRDAINRLTHYDLFVDFIENPNLSIEFLDAQRLIETLVIGILEIGAPSSSPFDLVENSLNQIKYNIIKSANESAKSFVEKLGISLDELKIDENRYESGTLKIEEKRKLDQIRNEFPPLLYKILANRLQTPIRKVKGHLSRVSDYELESCSIKQIGEVCLMVLLKENKRRKLIHFLEKTCPSDIVYDFAREPILLSLLADLCFDDRVSIKQGLVSQDSSQARAFIYQSLLDSSLSRLDTTSIGIDIKKQLQAESEESQKRVLESVLEELALCIAQSNVETCSFWALKKQLDGDRFVERELINILQRDCHKESDFRKLVIGILQSYYVRSQTNNKHTTLEFAHKSFGEFLFARRISQGLKRWSKLIAANESAIECAQFQEEVYDMLGYGLITDEILSHFSAILVSAKQSEIIDVFLCLNAFYLRWCNSLYLNYNDDENHPWSNLQKRQKASGVQLNLKHLDIFTGLNAIILLLEMHRHASRVPELLDKIVFSPCLDNDKDQFESTENLLLVFGYCQSFRLENFWKSPSEFFTASVGRFLEGIDLIGAQLVGINLDRANLKGAKLQTAKLTRTSLCSTNLEAADLTGADLSLSNLREVNIQSADFTDAILTGASIRSVDLRTPRSVVGADFTGASLTDVILSGVDLNGCILNCLDLHTFDLRDTDLSDASLQGCNLKGIDLRTLRSVAGANFTDVDITDDAFTGIDLNRCILDGLDLHTFDLRDTDLSDASLQGCNLKGIDLRTLRSVAGANFTDVDITDDAFTGIDLNRCILDGLDLHTFDLRDTDLSDASLQGCNLKGVDLRTLRSVAGANFTDVDITDDAFTGIDLNRCILDGLDLHTFDLRDTDLSDASLQGCNLEGVDLRILRSVVGVNFTGANLADAILLGVNFNGCSFSELSFSRVNLAAVDLQDIRFNNVDFSGVDLQQANLSGVDLRNCNIAGANFTGTIFDKYTQWPQCLLPKATD